MKCIVIFRTSGSYIDYNTYNCQELGLAKALSKKGYKVSLIMAGHKKKHIIYNNENDLIDIYYLCYKGLNQSLSIFLNWKELLEHISPDVVQIHEIGMLMSFFVARWAKKNKKKCVLIQGNYQTTQKPILKQLESIFNLSFGKKILKNVSAVGCKTEAAGEYIRYYGRNDAHITPVGLDEDKFVCESFVDNFFLSKMEGKHVLLYVGRMEKRRNPLFLIEIMKGFPDDYVLLLVGDGPLDQKIRAAIKEDHLSNVLYLGKRRQNELPFLYSMSNIFLLASNYEIFGMVIMESMYFGTPVLSTRTAGSETLINGDNGAIIEDLSVKKWKNKIEELCGDREKMKKMREYCQMYVRENFVWSQAVNNFEELYNI